MDAWSWLVFLFDEWTDPPLLLLLCSWTQVKQLEKGKVYAQGSMQKLSEITGKESTRLMSNVDHRIMSQRKRAYTWVYIHTHTYTGWTGSKVLYFGDSLWADLVDARRLKGWRTVRAIAKNPSSLLPSSP